MNKRIVQNLNLILMFVLILFSFTVKTFAQDEKVLIGKIVDSDGQPIIGAVVNVNEDAHIAISNEDGNFTLKNVNLLDKLYVTCLGYKDVTLNAEKSKDFKIVLQKIVDDYSDVLAMPFAKQQKRFIVNSTSTVYGDELVKHPVTVLQNAFTATVDGVETYESNSEPGWSETSLYVRGLRTMNSNARSPLIIVDDMERDLSFLDAYPIETITILKDAAATAIYGMRGANGVVLVTTKRGMPGRTRVNLTQEIGFQTAAGIPESQNSYNYALTYNQACYLDGYDPAYSDEDIQHYKEVCNGTLDSQYKYKYYNTNWHKEALRNLAPQDRTNISISGGNDRVKYFVSFTYLKQEGLYNTKWTNWNDGYSTQHTLNRFNLRTNVDINVNKMLSVSLDLGGRLDNISQPLASTWTIFTSGLTENLPIWPVFDPEGNWYASSTNSSKNAPALIAQTGLNHNRRRNLYSNVTATLNLDRVTKGLKAKATIGFDSYNTFQYTQSQNYDAFDYDFDSGTSTDPTSYTYTRTSTAQSLGDPTTYPRDFSYNINAIGSITYNRIFGKHSVDAQAMMRSYKKTIGTSGSDATESAQSSHRYLTYAGQLNYIYGDRYILQVAAAYQGCDNFAPGHRWGFFPGVSAGWLISEENFMKNSGFNLLKLRASYGKSGTSDIGASRYPYQTSYTKGSGYNFGTSQSYLEGVYESSTGNSNIQWEESRMLNLGFDFDYKNHAIYGSFDAFKEWRSKILVTPSTVPEFYGGTIPDDSKGKAETKGFEAMLGHKGHIGYFNYSVEGTVTMNINKITYNDETTPAEPYQRTEGQRIGRDQVFIKSQWASDESLISTSAEDALTNPGKYPYLAGTKLGNAVYVDENGDGKITTDDMVPYGHSSIPELLPSLKLGFSWKGLDARVILTAYLNRTVATRENMDYGFGWGGTSTHEVTKTWGYYTDDPTDPRNINALYPRLSTTFSNVDRNYPYNTSTVWIKNGNFLSLRNIEIGYSLPEKLIAKVNMTKCRFYFSGYNLKNWSHFHNGFDPENPTNYEWAYPKTKSFSLGVNIGF